MARVEHQEFFVRCASGFEGVLAQELKDIGMRRVRTLTGGASLLCSLEDAYRCCLWSRVATRVQLVLARIDARTADEFYEGVFGIAWEDLVARDASIAVRAHGVNEGLRNTQFTAVKVKDALCDRLRDRWGARPDVDPQDPDFSLDVSVHRTRATVALNLSGPSLHRRGYRSPGVQSAAPMKETLAAGMLLAAGWAREAWEGAAFVDPMCGSGTLAIEAALIACDIAPGSLRSRWGFEGWAGHDKAAWARLLDEAARRAEAGRAWCPRIMAADIDPQALELARQGAARAGVGELVHIRRCDAAQMGSYLVGRGGELPSRGLLATNPPYGIRLQAAEGLSSTYEALRAAVRTLPDGWKLAVITPDAGIDTAVGQVPETVIPCYNGALPASIHLYTIDAGRRTELRLVSLSGARRAVVVAERNSEQFAARLRKGARQRVKWARRAGVDCFRVYDADLPDYALAVDLVEGAGADEGRRFVRVTEYPAPSSVDAARAARRLADAAEVASAVLDARREDVVAIAARQDRDAHGRTSRRERRVVHTREGGMVLEADLLGRQDLGFALEQRVVRELLATMALGRSFASLLSYAGAATLRAAVGGASSTVTVDPSRGFLDWARRNMEANGFSGRPHRYACASPAEWLERERRAKRRYGLVFCAPPAGMLTGGHGGRGHGTASAEALVALVRDCAAVLEGDGTLVLACGRHLPKLDGTLLAGSGLALEDVSARTLPHDFGRTPKVQRCYLVTWEDVP